MLNYLRELKTRFIVWRTMRKLRKEDPFIYEE